MKQPGCPPELLRQARQVFLNQFDAVTRDELPSDARPWPEGVDEPHALGQPSKMPDGSWYALYPDGQVRVAARVRQGHVVWLVLGHGAPCGYAGDHPGGEAYYWNGYLEDFSPWDDTSAPYPAETSFGDWVRGHLEAMFRR